MSACNALNKKGSPCRGYANCGTGVCKMHADFFEPTHFFAFATRCCTPWQCPEQRDWLIRSMRSKSFRRDPYYAEMIASTVRDQPAGEWSRSSAVYLYEIFVKAGAIDPCTNPHLWRRYVSNRLDVLRYTAVNNRREEMMTLIVREFFAPFFQEGPIEEMLLYVLRQFINYNVAPEGNQYGITAQMWPWIFSTILASVPAPLLASLNRDGLIQRADKIAKGPGLDRCPWTTPLKEMLLGILHGAHAVAKNVVKLRMDPLKEELMAATWSPDRPRFLEWCLDVEELADWKRDWAAGSL